MGAFLAASRSWWRMRGSRPRWTLRRLGPVTRRAERSRTVGDHRGKTFVVTGGTSGIGAAAALALAGAGANVVIIGRHEARGRRLLTRIGRRAAGDAQFLRADLSSQAEVRALARALTERHRTIDGLINNAGARFDDYGVTADGRERTFATNHLSHFLLTCLLLGPLMRAPHARVVNVSSGSHGAASTAGGWELHGPGYDRRLAYAKSKLANILFTIELARRLAGTNVTTNAVDPGGVASRFALNNGLVSWLKHVVAQALRRELVRPRTGAMTVVHLATAADLEAVSGEFFRDRRSVKPSTAAGDREAAARLWTLSLEWTGLGPGVGPAWSVIQP
jgi:NAD(P)-dependent dehydrogenase (short-subunit alcohol dehydrogenase family)